MIGAPVLVGLALTTTALGALVPILRDARLTEHRFGRFILATGAAGSSARSSRSPSCSRSRPATRGAARCCSVFAVIAVGAGLLDHPRAARAGRAAHRRDHALVRPARAAARAAAARRPRRGRGIARARRGARRVRGRLHRRADHARTLGARLPRQAGRRRLRLPDPDLLHQHRPGVRPRLAARRPGSLLLVPFFASLFLLARGLPAYLLARRTCRAGSGRRWR